MDKKVSIIVPVYNAEKFLDRCVSSLANQTYKNLEIILVDDGSPDNSPKMCDEWAEKDSRIKVIHKSNGGVSSARNAGLELSSGEYLQFVDSDDYIELDFTQKMVEKYSPNVDWVVSGFQIINDSGEQKFYNITKFTNIDILQNANIFMEFVLAGYFDMPVNKLYKRELIKTGFQKDLPLGEDRVFNINYVKNVKNQIKLADSCGYIYEFNQSSACHKKRKDTYEILRVSVEELRQLLLQKFGKLDNGFYKLVGDFIVSVLQKTDKEVLKSKCKLLKTDELVLEYIKNYKPSSMKEKVKKLLIKLRMFTLLKLLINIKN